MNRKINFRRYRVALVMAGLMPAACLQMRERQRPHHRFTAKIVGRAPQTDLALIKNEEM